MSERPRSGGQISRLPYPSLAVGNPPGPLLEHDGVYGREEATAGVGGQRSSKGGGGGINGDGDSDSGGGGGGIEGVSSGSSESLRSDAASVG